MSFFFDPEYVPTPQDDDGPMPDKLKAVIEPPLTDAELLRISLNMHELVRPDHFYYIEAMFEQHRLDSRIPLPRPEMFQGLNGARRRGVIIRHNVKRRWEKLGIWNPKWGFAGRKMQPGDDFRKWTWWWQPEGVADDPHRAFHDYKLLRHVFLSRRNLTRGEHAPVIPRSRLQQDTTPAEAEAFLTSRPWFLHHIEWAEESTRYDRLSVEDKKHYPDSAANQVNKWWKDRGDLSLINSWKWRHESPPPEREDLAPIDNMKDSPLDAAAEMEFTPSEIDELETIDLPESEQPKGFWVIEDGDPPPYIPGQMIDCVANINKSVDRMRQRYEKDVAEGREPHGSLAWFREPKEGEPTSLFNMSQEQLDIFKRKHKAIPEQKQ